MKKAEAKAIVDRVSKMRRVAIDKLAAQFKDADWLISRIMMADEMLGRRSSPELAAYYSNIRDIFEVLRKEGKSDAPPPSKPDKKVKKAKLLRLAVERKIAKKPVRKASRTAAGAGEPKFKHAKGGEPSATEIIHTVLKAFPNDNLVGTVVFSKKAQVLGLRRPLAVTLSAALHKLRKDPPAWFGFETGVGNKPSTYWLKLPETARARS